MSNSEIASSWYDSVIANQTATAATVFMFYDFLITTGREVEAFWRRPVTAASILFFANKYISILNHILVFVTPLPQNDKSCTQIVLAGFVVELAQYIPWGAFSAMRTLALSRSRILAAIIAALFSVPFIVNFYLFRYKMDGKVDPLFGCQMHQDIHVPHSVTLKLTAMSRSSLILADIILIIITWWTIPRRHAIRCETRFLLARVLLLDGTVYFILLLILNSLHITFTLLSIFGTGGSSNMTAFTEPVTTVLTSRFLLDIQEASRRPVAAMSTDASMSGAANSSTAPWSSFAGSLSTAVYFSFIPDSQSSSEGGDEGE
ncbi:hypothetical protein L227DRAFT_581421 [Lentinus tigrinus ALCF2SS1-6]|uniref:DUF6533 domain-containing protein n=1 Tax=Lentinus tigrinus ALCF2SS1-6 TaxID=1328759 RepID=A0A5C2RT76_9APHY|nr:hypothetical protein L227DRAFT_581421 [Lentinus tigrinus ALCF2SS1-6]